MFYKWRKIKLLPFCAMAKRKYLVALSTVAVQVSVLVAPAKGSPSLSKQCDFSTINLELLISPNGVSFEKLLLFIYLWSNTELKIKFI